MTAALASTGLAPILAATSKKSTSGSSSFLLILIVIGAAFYFLIYRPQQKKARALREAGNSFEVGDEVLTAGGIVGYVIEIDGDRVTLETSVGASFVVLRQYVLRKIEPPVEEDEHVDHEDGIVRVRRRHRRRGPRGIGARGIGPRRGPPRRGRGLGTPTVAGSRRICERQGRQAREDPVGGRRRCR